MPVINIFETLLTEQFERFKTAFSDTSRKLFYDQKSGTLIHPGEFGTYREGVAKDFLRFFIPDRLSIGQGFVINSYNDVSAQCDLIVFDRNSTPLVQASERQRFFPVETV